MPEQPDLKRSPRTWEKIVVETDTRMSEAIAAFLADLTGGGVEISTSPVDQATGTAGPADSEKITAYLPLENSGTPADSEKTTAIRDFLDRLGDIFPGCQPPGFTTETIAEEDWNSLWKSYFHAFEVTPALTIKPSWEDDGNTAGTPGGRHFVIEMDPGMAFGTGHHASTQLALLLIEQLYGADGDRPRNVLDVGTGSGILAMASALFGATNVLGVDNDPDAVATAESNIKRNGLAQQVRVRGRDLASLQPGFELIAANIIHDTLAEMARVLSGLLAPGGYLVLSGILKGDQEDSIRGIYTSLGLRHVKTITRDEWAALLFQKG